MTNFEAARAYIIKLEEAFFDLLDGQSAWWEIQEQTGLSEKRCKQISDLYNELYRKYKTP